MGRFLKLHGFAGISENRTPLNTRLDLNLSDKNQIFSASATWTTRIHPRHFWGVADGAVSRRALDALAHKARWA